MQVISDTECVVSLSSSVGSYATGRSISDLLYLAELETGDEVAFLYGGEGCYGDVAIA